MINKIKNKALELRKQKNPLGQSLMTLLNDINMIGKNAIPPRESTNEEAIRTIRKTIQILNDNYKIVKDETKLNSIKNEIDLLETFLPKQLSNNELRNLIITFMQENNLEKSNKNIGSIMKFLNNNYLGQFEPKLANELIKEIFVS